jgi:anti-sigma factor RsiW
MTGRRRITEAELHAFVDGELAREERAEVEELLAASPADRELARELGELNEAIRARYAACLAEPAPAAVGDRLTGFASSPPGRRAFFAGGWLRAAALLLLVAGAAVAGYAVRGFMLEPRGRERAFVTMALGAHSVYVPEVRHPVEVKAEEAHLVRWLAKRVGADIRAPALADAGWKLMGGRLLPDQDGHPAAQFMYEDGSGRRLTLYIRKETGLGNTAFRFYEREGFGAFYWIDRPLAYALAGRLTRNELMSLANAVYARLESGADPARQP